MRQTNGWLRSRPPGGGTPAQQTRVRRPGRKGRTVGIREGPTPAQPGAHGLRLVGGTKNARAHAMAAMARATVVMRQPSPVGTHDGKSGTPDGGQR